MGRCQKKVFMKKPRHIKKRIYLKGKRVSVDVEICALIRKFNKILGITTAFCCVGDDDKYFNKDGYLYPYVSFNLPDLQIKNRIIEICREFCFLGNGHKIYVDENLCLPFGDKSFSLSFLDGKKAILEFQDFLCNKKDL